MAPFDLQRYLGLDDREFSEFQAFAQGRRWWQLLLWLAYAKRRRFVGALLGIAFVTAAGVLVITALMAGFEPWSHSLYLWPTLTGTWYGEYSTPDGPQMVELQIAGAGTDATESIDGSALTCDRRGTLRHFSISGTPHNWRGSRFQIYAARRDEFDDEGVQLGAMEGEWSGNAMRVIAPLERFKHVGGAWSSSTADPPVVPSVVHFNLVRGSRDDFAAACTGLRGAR